LESWRDFEQQLGTPETYKSIVQMFPRIVKRKKKDETSGDPTGEESLEYIFPDDETQKPKLKLLAKAYKWKQDQRESGDAVELPIEGVAASDPEKTSTSKGSQNQ
jgi:crooked neck